MTAVIDGNLVLEHKHLEIKSPSFGNIERGVPGLDGIVSVKLGTRGRKIIQNALLKAPSKESLDNLVEEITALVDGDSHTLELPVGESFENLRVDTVKTSPPVHDGGSIFCNCEITYTQLRGF